MIRGCKGDVWSGVKDWIRKGSPGKFKIWNKGKANKLTRSIIAL